MRLFSDGRRTLSELARPAPIRSAMAGRDANSRFSRYANFANGPLLKSIESTVYVDWSLDPAVTVTTRSEAEPWQGSAGADDYSEAGAAENAESWLT